MHRSGTSTVTRAINLLGVQLGEPAKMMPPTPDNAEGYWEHLEFYDLQVRLLAKLGRSWDIAEPWPAGWLEAEAIQPFKAELAQLIAANFANQPLWGWKEPRTCLLLPLWREVLEKSGTKLSCLFVVRNPVDVAGSLFRRDGVPFHKALGIWFHYNIVALRDAAGLPTVFLSYERLLAAWEPELRRCAAALKLDWPKDELQHRVAMADFIKPGLRHHESAPEQVLELPQPVQELYHALMEASQQPGSTPSHGFAETVNRLARDFHGYASFFPRDTTVQNYGPITRHWLRLQKSLGKQF